MVVVRFLKFQKWTFSVAVAIEVCPSTTTVFLKEQIRAKSRIGNMGTHDMWCYCYGIYGTQPKEQIPARIADDNHVTTIVNVSDMDLIHLGTSRSRLFITR